MVLQPGSLLLAMGFLTLSAQGAQKHNLKVCSLRHHFRTSCLHLGFLHTQSEKHETWNVALSVSQLWAIEMRLGPGPLRSRVKDSRIIQNWREGRLGHLSTGFHLLLINFWEYKLPPPFAIRLCCVLAKNGKWCILGRDVASSR